MATDKITTLLEQQLKTLGQKVRLDILKSLYRAERPLSFSELQREIDIDPSLINLSYHLNTLKEVNLIGNPSKKYIITPIGREILQKVLAIEEILSERDTKRMIRTSQYSTESFDLERIKRYLMREAQMNSLLAEKISKIVKKRLSKTKIEYLTTPLIREYINGILIEEGCEEYRHKLTRLGVPPYDTSMMFRDPSLSADSFIKSVGGEVSEQFLLLNLLPRELADLYLSKRLILIHLDMWALKPLSIIADIPSLINSIAKKNDNTNFSNDKFRNLNSSYKILKFMEPINSIAQHCSNDLLLLNFNELFNFLNIEKDKVSLWLDLIYSHIASLSGRVSPSVEIALNFEQNSDLGKMFIKKVKHHLSKELMGHQWNPSLFINYSEIKSPQKIYTLLNDSPQGDFHRYIFYDGLKSLINSTLNNLDILPSDCGGIQFILDKIFINLYQIAREAKQKDELFFEILEDRLNSCFELFSFKQEFLSTRYNKADTIFKGVDPYFQVDPNKWLSNAIKSISFISLNAAVKQHCGLELDRIQRSEDFAIDILKFMKERIEERNKITGDYFCLTQPHKGNYISSLKKNIYFESVSNGQECAYKMIRESSSLNHKKRISLFQRFHSVLDGNSLFEFPIDLNKSPQGEIRKIEAVLNSNIPAFRIII